MAGPNTTPQPPPKLVPPPRMSLAAVRRGPIAEPMRVLLYGVEGIGKSTFGAAAPTPIFLGAEQGTAELDVPRFPEPHSYDDVLAAVGELTKGEHKYQTLVVDTVDWLEPMIWAHVCKRDGQANVEAYGYGKGYTAALDEWRGFVAALERLWRARGMHVLLLGHCIVKTFKNPDGDDFDRYNLALHDKAAGLLKQWARTVLFANFKTHVLKDKKAPKAKGYGGGARVVYTERRAAWDAKNRANLPLELPLDWQEFAAAVVAGSGAEAAATLRAEIDALLPKVPDAAKREAIAKWLADDAGNSVALLRQGLNKVNALVPTATEETT